MRLSRFVSMLILLDGSGRRHPAWVRAPRTNPSPSPSANGAAKASSASISCRATTRSNWKGGDKGSVVWAANLDYRAETQFNPAGTGATT